MDLVKSENGELITTSKIIAEVFNKTHKHVKDAVENLECSDEFRDANFRDSSYMSLQNKNLKCYEITKDGFYFLCMGFTGKKSAQWKEAYIKAFNEMERGLLSVDSRMRTLSLEKDEVAEMGSQWAKFGHDINRKKKSITKRIENLLSDVQMKLEF